MQVWTRWGWFRPLRSRPPANPGRISPNLLAMSAVKEVYAALLFCRPHPPDHAVSLACHPFLRTGPFLDSTEAGIDITS